MTTAGSGPGSSTTSRRSRKPRGVLEPFDILFIGPEPGSVALRVVMPADGVAVPPPGATMAVEAKAGTVMRIGPAAVVEAALGRT